MRNNYIDGIRPSLARIGPQRKNRKPAKSKTKIPDNVSRWASKLRYNQPSSARTYPRWFEKEFAKGPQAVIGKALMVAARSRRPKDLEIVSLVISEFSKRKHNVAADVRDVLDDDLIKGIMT